jgi:hypothetical protein
MPDMPYIETKSALVRFSAHEQTFVWPREGESLTLSAHNQV